MATVLECRRPRSTRGPFPSQTIEQENKMKVDLLLWLAAFPCAIPPLPSWRRAHSEGKKKEKQNTRCSQPEEIDGHPGVKSCLFLGFSHFTVISFGPSHFPPHSPATPGEPSRRAYSLFLPYCLFSFSSISISPESDLAFSCYIHGLSCPMTCGIFVPNQGLNWGHSPESSAS